MSASLINLSIMKVRRAKMNKTPITPETLTGMFICSVDEILPEYLAPHLAMVIKNDILIDLRIRLQE